MCYAVFVITPQSYFSTIYSQLRRKYMGMFDFNKPVENTKTPQPVPPAQEQNVGEILPVIPESPKVATARTVEELAQDVREAATIGLQKSYAQVKTSEQEVRAND